MAIRAAFFLPHPPLIFEEVGKGQKKTISATVEAYMKAAQMIAALKPDTIVFVSPHTTIYSDYFHISPGEGAQGNFAMYGAPQIAERTEYDNEFVLEIIRQAQKFNLPTGTQGQREKDLDHATLIPLRFIKKNYQDFKSVRLGFSGLTASAHYEMGMSIKAASEELQRNLVFIASGDLSHKLSQEGPYGFNPAGPEFDEKICDVLSTANFSMLFKFDKALIENAAECGFRSLLMMAGALDDLSLKSDLMSYEGPFGVGYAVASFEVLGQDKNRNFLKQYQDDLISRLESNRRLENPYVSLARAALEGYICQGREIVLPDNLPKEMLENRSGVFVTLKKEGDLRGCIGTFMPTKANIALEITDNAIKAGTEDFRFEEVSLAELPFIEYSVDILEKPEPITSVKQLDAKIYGVIVSKGHKRGLLLPNLSGVDSPEEQIKIALKKAGIGPREKYTLERFKVRRYQ